MANIGPIGQKYFSISQLASLVDVAGEPGRKSNTALPWHTSYTMLHITPTCSAPLQKGSLEHAYRHRALSGHLRWPVRASSQCAWRWCKGRCTRSGNKSALREVSPTILTMSDMPLLSMQKHCSCSSRARADAMRRSPLRQKSLAHFTHYLLTQASSPDKL
jgi:hypothetical protein